MFSAFSTVFAVAVVFAVVFAMVIEVVVASLDRAVDRPMLYLLPSSHVSVVIADLMVSTFPLVILANAYMSVRTHIGKSFVIITCIVALFILETEFFSSSIELLQPGAFIAAIALSAIHLLVFLKIPTIIKIAMGIFLKTIGFTFRLTLRVMWIIFHLICIITSPLVLHTLVEVVIDLFHMIHNSNLPTIGLIVIVGSSFAMSLGYIGKQLLRHVLRVFEMITDEIASFLVPLPAEEAKDPDVINQLLPAQEEMSVLPRAAKRLVGRLLDVQKCLADEIDSCFVNLPAEEAIAPIAIVINPNPPAPAQQEGLGLPRAAVRLVEPLRNVQNRLTIQWSDGKASDSVRFRPYYQNGDTMPVDLFTGNCVEGKRLKEHCRRGYGCVLDQLTGLASSVQVVPNRAQEDRGSTCRSVYQTLDESYRLQSVAQTALRDLRSLYEEFKQRSPRRNWSVYQKRLNECCLFQQGMDMLFLEMRMRAEFHPNPALKIVQDTLEEAEMDRLDDEEEVGVPPREAVELVPQNASAEEPVFSAEQDIVEEEDEVPIVPKKCRRSQLRREQAALISGLGKYWTLSKPARKLPRRSTRVKREPQRYGFVP